MKTKMTRNIHQILIAVDGSPYSDHIIDYGVWIAEKMDSKIAVVHINELPMAAPFTVDPLSNEPSNMVMGVMQAQEDANKELFKYIQKTWGKEIPLHIYAKVGKPKDEILATAAECNADLIILGTHGRVGFDHFISGSVAEGVVRKAKCPVLIIPNRDEEKKSNKH